GQVKVGSGGVGIPLPRGGRRRDRGSAGVRDVGLPARGPEGCRSLAALTCVARRTSHRIWPMSVAALSEALPLNGWENFYVIVGSSAAALTGLTFIVITIAADAAGLANTPRARLSGLRAFITPTTVHFASVLWMSALLSVPGQTVFSLALCLGISGLAGIVYCTRVILWMLEILSEYKPFIADWIWSAVLPFFAYACLLAVALLLPGHPVASLYVVGGITLLLLFIGIHNAWD